MCGILGYVSHAGPTASHRLERARDLMQHRGPDDAGLWMSEDGRLALAHRRLAIVDLSASGHQPMHSEDGMVSLVFNGEIYNHLALREELAGTGMRFRGRSDTETLLAAYLRWGRGCVARLHGMFALGLLDRRTGHLLLARDRAGEKPLYVCDHANGFGFASTLGALRSLVPIAPTLALSALDAYLGLGYIPPHLSIIEGFRQLAPAHALCHDLETGATESWCYWTPPAPLTAQHRSLTEATDQLEQHLLASVGRQMQADVPVGVLLSGGIDSGLVTAAVARVGAGGVRAFTVRMPDTALDESARAAHTARHVGIPHQILDADAVTPDLLESLIGALDEPLGDSSIVPTYLVSHAIRQEATVALGGDGGDELFGGYAHHRARLNPLLHRALPRPVRRVAYALASRLYPPTARGRGALSRALGPWPRPLAGPALFDPQTRVTLVPSLRSVAQHGTTAEDWLASLPPTADQSNLALMTRRDFASYLPGDILAKVDRMSMHVSLEVRAPLLDVDLLDFAFGTVTDAQKVHGGEGKILLRALASRWLPKDVAEAPKRGFSIPTGPWLSGPWRHLAEDHLRSSRLRLPAAVAQTLMQQAARSSTSAERVFALIVLGRWLEDQRLAL